MIDYPFDEVVAHKGQALVLVRGVPGSGKTTLAKKLHVDHNFGLIAADDYFTFNGEYKWDRNELGVAHAYSQLQARYYLYHKQKVVVHNTSLVFSEVDDYFLLLDKGAMLSVVTMTNEYGSVHDVPEESMARLRNRMMHHNDFVNLIKSDLDFQEIKTKQGSNFIVTHLYAK